MSMLETLGEFLSFYYVRYPDLMIVFTNYETVPNSSTETVFSKRLRAWKYVSSATSLRSLLPLSPRILSPLRYPNRLQGRYSLAGAASRQRPPFPTSTTFVSSVAAATPFAGQRPFHPHQAFRHEHKSPFEQGSENRCHFSGIL
jgi:hypothetical protein